MAAADLILAATSQRGGLKAVISGPEPDKKTVAAIVAALAAYLEEPGSYRVVGLRRLGSPASPPGQAGEGPSLWALAGRQAVMAARQGTLARKGSRS